MPLAHTTTLSCVKFDTSGMHNKFLLHNQFVAWYCKSCSIAPLPDYANNSVFQELPTRGECFTSTDKKIFIDFKTQKKIHKRNGKLHKDDSDLTITIQPNAWTENKTRLCITGYYQVEHLYSMTRERLIINHKEYGVNKQKHGIS